jgi:hypothetical protein
MGISSAIMPCSRATIGSIGNTGAMIPATIRPVRAISVARITAVTPNSDRSWCVSLLKARVVGTPGNQPKK